MKKHRFFALIFALITVLVAVVVALFLLKVINISDFMTISGTIASIGLFAAAIYGFHSNREAIRLQTSMSFSLDVYKELHSDEFKSRERYIQKELSLLQDNVCAIEDLKNPKLKDEITKYCGYMDGIGILVMEHMIKPEIILYNAGVGLLRTFYLLKPFLDESRKKRYDNATCDLKEEEVNGIIKNSVKLYYANMELLALEMRRRGPELIKKHEKRLKVSNR